MNTRSKIATLVASLLLPWQVTALWAYDPPRGGGSCVTVDNRPNDGLLRVALPSPTAAFAPTIEETHSLTPWCEVDLTSLASCNGTVACGPLDVPCLHPQGGQPVAGGVDVLAVGAGLRGRGETTLHLRGAEPATRHLASAVVWGVITRDPENDDSRSITFEGPGGSTTVWGELLSGTHVREPCWEIGEVEAPEEARFAAYVADVSHVVAADGTEINGDYRVTVSSAAGTGEDPWRRPLSQSPGLDRHALLEGVSLISLVVAPDRQPHDMVALHAGPVFLEGDLALIHPLSRPLPSASRVRLWTLGADGQARRQDGPVGGFKTWFATSDDGWIQLRGDGSPIDTRQDWQGSAGGPIDQLWDTMMTEAQASQLAWQAGALSYQVGFETVPIETVPLEIQPRLADCVVFVMDILATSSPLD